MRRETLITALPVGKTEFLGSAYLVCILALGRRRIEFHRRRDRVGLRLRFMIKIQRGSDILVGKRLGLRRDTKKLERPQGKK